MAVFDDFHDVIPKAPEFGVALPIRRQLGTPAMLEKLHQHVIGRLLAEIKAQQMP